MRMLPWSKPKAVEDKIRAWHAKQISQKLDPEKVNVIGVRGYYLDTMGKSGENDRGIYDDACFIIAPDTFLSYNFNTDPSSYKQGRATLEDPQIVLYKPGYHGYGRKSGHMAFRQASSVVVRRDGDKGNGKRIEPGLFSDKTTAKFWINLHKGGQGTTSSAGCQTVPASQWDSFYSTMRMLLKRHEQTEFFYHLIHEPRQKRGKKGYWHDGEFHK